MLITPTRNTIINNYSNQSNPNQNRTPVVSYRSVSMLQTTQNQNNSLSFSGLWVKTKGAAKGVVNAGKGVGKAVKNVAVGAKDVIVEAKNDIAGALKRDDSHLFTQVEGTLEEIGQEFEKRRQEVRDTYILQSTQTEKIKILDEFEAQAKERQLGILHAVAGKTTQEASQREQRALSLPQELEQFRKGKDLARLRKIEKIHADQSGLEEKTGFARISGYKDVQAQFDEHFVDQIKAEKQGQDVHIPGSVLFFGPPGNGKTTYTRGFAEATGCNFVPIKIVSKTEESKRKFMAELAKKAEDAKEKFKKDRTRTIIFVDEIDKVARKGSSICGDLQKFMETCSDTHHCTLFAATNHPSELGLDMSHDEIFPFRISIAPPDREHKGNAMEVFRHYLDGKSQKMDYNALADALIEHGEKQQGAYSNRQIEEISRKKFCQDNKCHPEKLETDEELTQENVLEHLKRTEPQINNKDIEQFNRDVKTFTPDTEEK